MDLELKDKVVIVTGGAKGIGAAIVRACAAEGAVPVIIDRDADAGGQLRNELRSQGGACGAVTVELSTPENCYRAVEQALKTFGRLDALVNNAGSGAAHPFDAVDDAAWETDLELKLFAAVRLTRAALPLLQASRGAVLNILALSA